MKIIVITNLYPNDKKPQYGTFVFEQVESLRKVYAGKIKVDVHFVDSSQSLLNYIRSMLSLRKIINKEGYEIAHVHYGLTLVSTLLIPIPVVVTFHGTDLMLWYVKIISKLLKLKTRHQIVVSKNMKKEMPSADIVPCGINSKMFALPDNKLQTRFANDVGVNRLKILFPSNPIVKVKNYPLFNKICEEFQNRGIKVDRIHLYNINREEVPGVFWKSDIMILTSFREGSPTVIKEAIAAKLPFVSVDVGDVKEWAERVKFGSVCKTNDPKGIVDIALNLLKNIKSESDLDNSKVVEQIDNKTISKRIKNIYDTVLKKHRNN